MKDEELRWYLDEIVTTLKSIEKKPTQYFIEYKGGVAPVDVIERIRRSIERGPTS